MNPNQREGFFLILISTFGYALFPIFTRQIYATSDLTPLDLGVWRFLVASCVLWFLVTINNRNKTVEPLPKLKLLGLGILYFVAAFTAFVGLELISASVYVVLFFTYPSMVALISIFLGHPLPRIGWFALLLTFVGILLTVPHITQLSSDDILGVLMAILNALSVAVLFILSGRILKGYKNITQGTAWIITGAFFTFLVTLVSQPLTVPQTTETWLNLVGMGVISTALPIFAINSGIQKIGAPRAAIISSVEPVQAMILAMILLGEMILPLQWVGAALIISGVLLLQLRPNVRLLSELLFYKQFRVSDK